MNGHPAGQSGSGAGARRRCGDSRWNDRALIALLGATLALAGCGGQPVEEGARLGPWGEEVRDMRTRLVEKNGNLYLDIKNEKTHGLTIAPLFIEGYNIRIDAFDKQGGSLIKHSKNDQEDIERYITTTTIKPGDIFRTDVIVEDFRQQLALPPSADSIAITWTRGKSALVGTDVLTGRLPLHDEPKP